MGTFSLTQSRGFPTPCLEENLRGPGALREIHLTLAGGINAYGEWGVCTPQKCGVTRVSGVTGVTGVTMVGK